LTSFLMSMGVGPPLLLDASILSFIMFINKIKLRDLNLNDNKSHSRPWGMPLFVRHRNVLEFSRNNIIGGFDTFNSVSKRARVDLTSRLSRKVSFLIKL
jgi:hypothetical protein